MTSRPADAIKRMLAAFEAEGRPIVGARLMADGSIELLTADAVRPLASPAVVTSSWVDLTGEAEAGRA